MRHYLTILVCAVLLAACSKEKTPAGQGQFEPLQFNLDSTRLGGAIEIADLRFHAPARWLEVDSSTFEKIANVAGRDTSVMQLQPTRVFKHENGGPMLLVSRFPRAVDLKENFVPWAGEVARVYRAQRKDTEIRESWIQIAGVDALQLVSTSAQLVHVKVILNANEPVSLDYTVPVAMWPVESVYIESSLGSLRRVTR